MNNTWGYASIAIYAASFFCYARFLYTNDRRIGRVATLCLALGIVLQYSALMERSRWIHSVPYDDLYGSMSLFAWLLGSYLSGTGIISSATICGRVRDANFAGVD